jgi:ribosomal RNA-processing protein 12
MEGLYQTILILFSTRNREIVKSCLGFVKSTCTILTHEQLKANIKATIENIFLWIDESKNRFRLKIKLMLQKFISQLGYEPIQQVVPPEHHKLLASVRRDMQRNGNSKDKKPKDEKEKASGGAKKAKKAGDEMEDSDDEAMDSDDDFVDQFRQEPSRAGSRDEGEDDVVDLLDPSASKMTGKRRAPLSSNNEEHFRRDKQGRLVIAEDGDSDDEESPTGKKGLKSIPQMVTESGGTLAPTKGKRSRLPDVGDEDEDQGTGPAQKKRKANTGEANKRYTGKEYRSNKGAGDMKVSGRHEPFAYMPMDPQLLNKRKAQKVAKQYKSVVASAQKGASKGSKGRKTHNKRT